MPEHEDEQHPDLPDEPEGQQIVWPADPSEIPVQPDMGLGGSGGPVAGQPEPFPAPAQPQTSFEAYDPTEHEPEPADVLLDDQGNVLPTFSPEHREDFEGLLYLGALTHSFSWLGHRFRLRSLNTDQMLAVTMLTREFDQSMGQGLAYKAAMVACATVSVDGKDLPIPIGSSDDVYAWARARFDHCVRWFPQTIEAVYAEYMVLDAKIDEVMVAMGKASAPTA